MGFWHTSYMEFHEDLHTEDAPVETQPLVECQTCGAIFISRRDLQVHLFAGHAMRRPILMFRGRECGRSRLTVSTQTTVSDWAIVSADVVRLNGVRLSADEAIHQLAAQRQGVVDVELSNAGSPQRCQFEFALADEEDLSGVDQALRDLIDSGELSTRSIDHFITKSKNFETAAKYLGGLANYLYGVLERESRDGHQCSNTNSRGYEARYDKAVNSLRDFDREPAEAICGLVAFHYNQFERAMSKTRSRRVAEVSFRLQSILRSASWDASDIARYPADSLDHVLSDSVTERVISWSGIPLDGTATEPDEMASAADHERPADAFKLHLVLSEHYLVAGDTAHALRHAEQLRHTRLAEDWFTSVKRCLEEGRQA